MNPNANLLSLRDPARAALIGAIDGADFGQDGRNFGYQFGADGSAGHDLIPNAQNMQLALTEKREALINPNGNSSAKIQRYVFALESARVFGTAAPGIALTNKPRTQFRPQRVTCNVPFQNLFMITSMQVANVGILVGGKIDAYDFAADGIDQELDVPTLGPQNEVSVVGNWTAIFAAADPFATGNDFDLTLSFKGPATMAGG